MRFLSDSIVLESFLRGYSQSTQTREGEVCQFSMQISILYWINFLCREREEQNIIKIMSTQIVNDPDPFMNKEKHKKMHMLNMYSRSNIPIY